MTEMRPTNLPPIENRDLEHASHLRFYKNGDHNFGGRVITWNKRRIRTFDSFLTELTNALKLTGGCVRRVYTPRLGHRITDFEKLEEGGIYVAAGQEAFRKLE
ncbi:hypothetical protein SNE40_022076 [Patella caerulea]|uniref:Doublecortin domain-containing protein n=2 Tax=Patella TaxID=6463 RepID=A0AAN8J4F3_PATCE